MDSLSVLATLTDASTLVFDKLILALDARLSEQRVALEHLNSASNFAHTALHEAHARRALDAILQTEKKLRALHYLRRASRADAGAVWCWGTGRFGELGLGNSCCHTTIPARIPCPHPVTAGQCLY